MKLSAGRACHFTYFTRLETTCSPSQYFTLRKIEERRFLTQNQRWNKSHKTSFEFETPPLSGRISKAMALQYKESSFHQKMKLKLGCDFAFPTYEWVWTCFGGTLQIQNFSPCIACFGVYILCSQEDRCISRCSVPCLGLDFKLSKMGDTGSPPTLHIWKTVSSP